MKERRLLPRGIPECSNSYMKGFGLGEKVGYATDDENEPPPPQSPYKTPYATDLFYKGFSSGFRLAKKIQYIDKENEFEN